MKGGLVIGHSAIGVYLGFGVLILELIKMDIILSKERVDAQECDVLVTGFFRDERPLKGSCGWVDWRLNGMLSRFLIKKRLIGDWKEIILIPSQDRVMPRMILLLGLGEVKDYNHLLLRELPLHLLETLRKLGALNVCLSLPFEESYRVGCGKLAEALIEGIAGFSDLSEYPLSEEWIKRLRCYFAEGDEHFSEILSGVRKAKDILGNRIQIKIFTPPESTFPKSTRIKP